MSVYRNNSIGILRNNCALGIHTEGPHLISIFLCPIHNFTFIQLICQVRKYIGRKLYPDSNINPVRAGGNLQLLTDPLHPFASASSYRNNTLFALIGLAVTENLITSVHCRNRIYRRIKIKIHLFLQLRIQIFQNQIVNICTQMAYRCIQKMKVMLNTFFFKLGTGSRIQLRSCPAITQINIIYIIHQIKSLLLTNILVQSTAKIIGNIVLSI